MSRIGFVGTGHIAAPMVRFLAGRGHEITVSKRNSDVAADLAASHGVAVADNQDVVDGSEIVFLCVRPHVAVEVLRQLQFTENHRIVSVIAGVSLANLADLCAPARDIVATIPLGFLEQGGCPLAACPKAGVLEELFAPENPVVPVPDEAGLNAHFAICAMVPGLLDLMGSAAGWLGETTGDRAAAEFYTAELVAGFLAAMGRDEGVLARERDALATEGTISLQMVTGLREGGAHRALLESLADIGQRLAPK
ncbi:NAD(P)-binding domain-containing protein [Amaricoccus macauensis]|uniref:NAD(P)-binding domain-containing protein n=1 Tax=Amaricoccus macauensis TaxID=57001 RepID=UPI003C7D3F32